MSNGSLKELQNISRLLEIRVLYREIPSFHINLWVTQTQNQKNKSISDKDVGLFVRHTH